MKHNLLCLLCVKLLSGLAICISLPQSAFAHRPIFTDDAATSQKTAIHVKEPNISQVVYREITDKTPQVWLAFTAPKDFTLFIQIGVPVIDRLKDFRPAMAVIGPGLQGEAAPFKIPANTGTKVFPTQEVAKPRFFHEHFTGTDSWILRSETVKLSEPGRYYVVAFSPQQQTGKLWLSIGKKESFGLKDILEFPIWKKKVQEFHEVKKEEPLTNTVEIRRLDQSSVDIKMTANVGHYGLLQESTRRSRPLPDAPPSYWPGERWRGQRAPCTGIQSRSSPARSSTPWDGSLLT